VDLDLEGDAPKATKKSLVQEKIQNLEDPMEDL
jgi:hypothetical protein